MCVREFRAKIAATHCITSFCSAGFAKILVPHAECCTECAASITGSRLNENIFESFVAHELAVGDAVERDAASEAKIFHARCLAGKSREPTNDEFGDFLHRSRKVHFALCQF